MFGAPFSTFLFELLVLTQNLFLVFIIQLLFVCAVLHLNSLCFLLVYTCCKNRQTLQSGQGGEKLFIFITELSA